MAVGSLKGDKKVLTATDHCSSLPQKDSPKAEVFALIGRGQMGSLIASALQKVSKADILVLHSQSTPSEWNECKRADILIDFSHASAVARTCELACRFKKPLLVGTTGWELIAEELKKRVIDAQIPFLYSPNFSWGIFALRKALIQVAKLSSLLHLSEGVLSEKHGKNKADAPSGTAKQLAKDVTELFGFENIDISSQRIGNHPGRHILTLNGSEEVIELSHTAKSRRGFALGAIASSRWLIDQRPGWYTMDDLAQPILAQKKNLHH